MTTVVLVAAGAVTFSSTALALMLCVCGARADRRLRNALLEALGWRANDWAVLERPPGSVPPAAS